jgi:type II secretory pathway pseudopilin PulG
VSTGARADEAGTTLVELLATLAIMSVVGVLLFGFLFSVINTTTRATSDTETEKRIQLALRPLTADVRGATTVSQTYPAATSCPTGSYPTGYTNCLSLTILRPEAGALTCPRTVVTYGLKPDGTLREDRTEYRFVGGSCVATTLSSGRVVLAKIQNGTTPLFTYYDSLGNVMNPAASGQTTAAIAGAARVRVSLNVQYRSGSPLLRYSTDLAMRNNR